MEVRVVNPHDRLAGKFGCQSRERFTKEAGRPRIDDDGAVLRVQNDDVRNGAAVRARHRFLCACDDPDTLIDFPGDELVGERCRLRRQDKPARTCGSKGSQQCHHFAPRQHGFEPVSSLLWRPPRGMRARYVCPLLSRPSRDRPASFGCRRGMTVSVGSSATGSNNSIVPRFAPSLGLHFKPFDEVGRSIVARKPRIHRVPNTQARAHRTVCRAPQLSRGITECRGPIVGYECRRRCRASTTCRLDLHGIHMPHAIGRSRADPKRRRCSSLMRSEM